MDKKYKRIARNQLDNIINKLKDLKKINVPIKGWIKAIRENIGMTGEQLAKRMNVTQPRISRLEKDEISGNVTLRVMQEVAEALNCRFIYAILPKKSLEDLLKDQARKIVEKKYNEVNHTMGLEAQNIDKKTLIKEIELSIEEIIKDLPKTLWDKI